MRRMFCIAYLFVAIFSGVGLLGKAPYLSGILHLPIAVLGLLGFIGLVIPLGWQYALRFRGPLSGLVLAGLAVCLFILFPRMQMLHSTGHGSDQPDCVIVAAHGLAHGQWPYDRSAMWTHNPMSCGPGWVALQSPAILAGGYTTNLILLWTVSLTTLGVCAGWSTVSGVLALAGLSPAFWLAAVNGSDFLPFGICMAALLTAMYRLGGTTWGRTILTAVLTLICQFRVVTLLLPVLLAKKIGKTAAAVAIGASLACELIFIVWNSAAFVADGPLFIIGKVFAGSISGARPVPTALALCIPVIAVSAFLLLREKPLPIRLGVLFYLSFVLILPALLDLPKKLHQLHSWQAMLQNWEGSMWLVACIPVFALFLVMENPVLSQRDAPDTVR